MKVTIFTDGSSIVKKDKNGYISGGIGVYFNDNSRYNISKGYYDAEATNQKMELLAALKGLEKAIYLCYDDIVIYTDSMYLVNSMNKWAPVWKKNKWKKKKGKQMVDISHKNIIKKLYDIQLKYNVKYIHVHSHLKEPSDKTTDEWNIWYGNMMADVLANNGRNKNKNKNKNKKTSL